MILHVHFGHAQLIYEGTMQVSGCWPLLINEWFECIANYNGMHAVIASLIFSHVCWDNIMQLKEPENIFWHGGNLVYF